MQIIKKDISWLLERVPDFSQFFDDHKPFFNGGYLAGGFVRKMILAGSALEVKKNMKSGDIDFFYHDIESCESAYRVARREAYKEYFDRNPQNQDATVLVPNSIAGFAYEIFLKDTKYQFICKNLGPPEKVIHQFDISNCKAATDGKSVWIVEDWEELEKNKQIRIDNYAGKYLLNRMKKYLSPGYSTYTGQKEELLYKMLAVAKEYHAVSSPFSPSPLHTQYEAAKRLLSKTEIYTPEELLLFYDKLGIISVNEGNYDNSAIGPGVFEDYALHVYKNRIKNTNDAKNARPHI
jgi:hypothetical protein